MCVFNIVVILLSFAWLDKKKKVKLVTRRLPFQKLLHRGVGEGATLFP